MPKIGMRNMKSAIAVIVCFLLWQMVRLMIPDIDLHPLYAYAAVVLSMRGTTSDSLTYGKIRVKATIVGLIVALACISFNIPVQTYVYYELLKIIIELVLIVLGVVLSLYLASITKCGNFCAIASVVFLVCMIRYNNENRYVYALLRTFETAMGVSISLLINRFVFPYQINKKGGQNE